MSKSATASDLLQAALADLPPRQLYPSHPDWDAYQAEVSRRMDPIVGGLIDAWYSGYGEAFKP